MGSRFCPDHARLAAARRSEYEQWRSGLPQRRLAKRVYSDPRWRRCRERVLERDGHACVRCGGVRGLNGHHVLGITGTDDDFDPELVITLCADCHPIAEAERRAGY